MGQRKRFFKEERRFFSSTSRWDYYFSGNYPHNKKYRRLNELAGFLKNRNEGESRKENKVYVAP